MSSLSFDAGVRHAEWAGHIVIETGILIGALGQPPDLDRLDDPLIWRGVERSFQVISEAVIRFHNAGIDLPGLEPEIEIAPLRAAALRLKARFESGVSS